MGSRRLRCWISPLGLRPLSAIQHHSATNRYFSVNYCRLLLQFAKNIFASLCENGEIDFTPSKIGSYWINDIGNENTQIDVIAVDNKKKLLFVGECKYHNAPVDANVYFNLKKKVDESCEINKVFKNFKIIYGVFSKSGFKPRLLDVASTNENILLINENSIVK